jgi:hypothetical protein
MSKVFDRKWRIAGCLGFALALSFDLIGKHIAAERMTEIAGRTAGLPIEPRGWLDTQFSIGIAGSFELVLAALAAVCWAVSARRSEPGSSLTLAVLATLCLVSFFITV